jgi:hypothetical protein
MKAPATVSLTAALTQSDGEWVAVGKRLMARGMLMYACTSAASSTASSLVRATDSHVAVGGTGSVVRSQSTLPFILIVMTSGTAVMGGDGGWRGDGQNGGCGAVGGADDGVLGDDCRRLAATVALSNARNDWAATGSNSFRSSANDESMFAASVGTS